MFVGRICLSKVDLLGSDVDNQDLARVAPAEKHIFVCPPHTAHDDVFEFKLGGWLVSLPEDHKLVVRN